METTGNALYKKHHSENYLIYSPWFEEPFKTIYEAIKEHTVVKEDRCYVIERMVRQTASLGGECAECGTYKGGTAYLIAETLQNAKSLKHLCLFDTFCGMPTLANDDPSGHVEGDFGDTSLDSVKSYLKRFNTVRYFQGTIPHTLDAAKDMSFSFVHVDVDLYQTVKDCCAFFYTRLISGGVMIFDDYGFRKYEYAAKKAVDEFFMDKPEVPIALPTGQSFVIKL